MNEKAKYRKIAEANGISNNMFNNRLYLGWSMERAATEKKHKKKDQDIAIYQGDDFWFFGTLSYVSKRLGKSEKEVLRLCTPSIRKRSEQSNQLYGIYIEDDEYASRHFQ